MQKRNLHLKQNLETVVMDNLDLEKEVGLRRIFNFSRVPLQTILWMKVELRHSYQCRVKRWREKALNLVLIQLEGPIRIWTHCQLDNLGQVTSSNFWCLKLQYQSFAKIHQRSRDLQIRSLLMRFYWHQALIIKTSNPLRGPNLFPGLCQATRLTKEEVTCLNQLLL